MQPADFLRTRRSASPKLLTTPAPAGPVLDDILTIAIRTPDHGRLFPWRFVVLTGDGLTALAEAVGRAFAGDHPEADTDAVAASRQRFDAAPMIIAVVSTARPDNPANPKIPEFEQLLSAGAVCMNLMHACHAHGFGAVWLSGWASYHPDVLAHLGLEGHERLAGFVHVGTESAPQDERPRPQVATITTIRS